MKTVISSLAEKRQQAGLLVAGFFEGDKLDKSLETREPVFAEAFKKALASGRFEGKFAQIFTSFHPDFTEAQEIVLFGLGKKSNYKSRCVRKAAANLVQIAKARKTETLRVWLESLTACDVSAREAAAAISEASILATYEFSRYKSAKKDAKEKKLEKIELVQQKKADAATLKSIEEAAIVAEGVCFARDLINEPANIMNATRLTQVAKEWAKEKGADFSVIDQAELKRLKMGGILAVNAGSRTPAALIILEHGKQYKKNGTVCLVGKGVTFDTGGISIKPAKDMEKMKYDMSGASAVIAAVGVAAALGLKKHVVGLAPAVENNVSENPQRPGDIIRMYNGKSVEVLNTDAEGRLILGDALSYSAKYEPKAIVDLATLTGMCAYTFGPNAIGLMTNDEKLAKKVTDAGESVGERCWPLPMWDEYGDQIRGHHSDLYNIGGPYGGTITAAKFLQEFIPEKTAWVHLDIAGTAWADSNRPDCVKGGTGVGVRLLTQFLRDF